METTKFALFPLNRKALLHQEGFGAHQISRLVEKGEPLVREYLAIYAENNSPEQRERLDEQIQRFQKGPLTVQSKKKGRK